MIVDQIKTQHQRRTRVTARFPLSTPIWAVGTLLALAVSIIASVLLVKTATSAGLSTTGVSILRGALPIDGLSQFAFSDVGTAAHGTSTQAPPIPAHPVRTALVLLHVVGLTIGMGAALFLDLFLLARLYHRRIDQQTIELLAFGSRLVGAGLCLLWASGIGVLVYYYVASPQALENPKLIAKVAAVCALTLNGMALHRIVLPMVRRRINQPLLANLPLSDALPAIAIGVTSGVSWGFCCVLGMVKELNGVAPAHVLIGCYIGAIALAVAVGVAAHSFLTHRPRPALAL